MGIDRFEQRPTIVAQAHCLVLVVHSPDTDKRETSRENV
jgi:hypothetical protein